MTEKEELKKEISELEAQINPKRERLSRIFKEESEAIDDRVNKTRAMQDKFTLDELLFASHERCECGAGFAYPKGMGMWGSWNCSAILLGRAEKGSTHSSAMPFSFYEVKSEDQPSANGATTRPKE